MTMLEQAAREEPSTAGAAAVGSAACAAAFPCARWATSTACAAGLPVIITPDMPAITWTADAGAMLMAAADVSW
ncbi:hypothetical protein [Streptomyces himalayensis]|uniref:Uncharacterized protein n=1 Tax=Streptomyces himalayensis subsp. himalayensis TaxID=2756131 RepID=A0A7W0DQ94_9ACTN|nr:hypothetical protein [Streptomyces himalayensis]MBA2948900.1 hypothetical protein [Streptomyces himalayensis subsp. himalayensis]